MNGVYIELPSVTTQEIETTKYAENAKGEASNRFNPQNNNPGGGRWH
jgi:hypothetical protein